MSFNETRTEGSASPGGTVSLADSPPERLASRLRELEQRSKELAVVNAIAQVVARTPDISDILEQSLQRLLEFMDLEAGAVFLVDAEAGELVQLATVGFSERYRRALRRLKVGDQLTGRVARDGRPIFVEDISKDRRITNLAIKLEGIRSFAGIPLTSNGRTLGVMNVISKEFRRFESTDADLLTAVGNQLAVAIDNAQLFEKSAELVVLEERNWLAREIHDTLAQGLVALTLQIELAITMLPDEPGTQAARASLQKALELARENLEEARRSVLSLRGDRVTHIGLANAMAELVAKFTEETGIGVMSFLSGKVGRLPVNVEEGLHRIAQEALSNVRNHSHARAVSLSLQRRGRTATLTIRDDGVGFDPTQDVPAGHFGIRGMGERASLLGGRLDIQSRPGHGTLVRAVVPIHAAAQETKRGRG
jgi:two-component system NarL family sensor kinase